MIWFQELIKKLNCILGVHWYYFLSEELGYRCVNCDKQADTELTYNH